VHAVPFEPQQLRIGPHVKPEQQSASVAQSPSEFFPQSQRPPEHEPLQHSPPAVHAAPVPRQQMPFCRQTEPEQQSLAVLQKPPSPWRQHLPLSHAAPWQQSASFPHALPVGGQHVWSESQRSPAQHAPA